ncbi:hypothetical protein ACHAXT_002925 [Thalassiosira profunda]
MDNLFGAGGGGGGPEQWFLSLPYVTRVLLGSTLVVTALANLDVIQGSDLEFARWEDVVGRGDSGKVEAWRFGFNMLISLHLMTQISSRYERMGPICTRRLHINPQNRRADTDGNNGQPNAQLRIRGSPYYPRGETPDFVFALLLGMAGILLSHALMIPKLPHFITRNRRHHFFHRHISFFIVYIWSKQHPQRRVNFFSVNLAAAYLPFAYLVLGYALNQQTIPVDMLHGMFIGHVYFWLACVVPRVLGGGRAVLSTPLALVDLCHWLEGRGPLARGGGVGEGGGDNQMLVDVDGVIGGYGRKRCAQKGEDEEAFPQY